MKPIRILEAGEQGLVVEFGDEIDPVVNARVHRLAGTLMAQMPTRILEVVPTYRSLMIYFDPAVISWQALQQRVAELLESPEPAGVNETRRTITIPVCYGGEFGPDLEFVARHNGITAQEVIALHSSLPYLVYMLGFMPGFPYLGGLPERIAAPRLAVPRVKIAAGSVGIAARQTGIYPVESPGGWQLIGRTPVTIFRPLAPSPFLFAAGDYLQFAPISEDEYISIREQVDSGTYAPLMTVSARGENRAHSH